jgi:ribonucleotide reductase alpha subunit
VSLDTLRPEGAKVSNPALTSSGITSYAERFSNTTREVGQCIAQGEKVLTHNGLKNIEDVCSGQDTVWSEMGWVNVKNVVANGIKEVYAITTQKGYTVRTTLDHVFLCRDEEICEKSVKDFTLNQMVALLPGTPCTKVYTSLNTQVSTQDNGITVYTLPHILEEKLAYILGYAYGGKCIFDTCLSVVCLDIYPAIYEKIQQYTQEIFACNVQVHRHDGQSTIVSIDSMYISDFLTSNNLLDGKSSHVVFPEKIIQSNSAVQLAFIAGYFDANGINSKKTKGYVFTSINKMFLEQVQRVLLANGIVSQLKEGRTEEENWYIFHSVIVTGYESKYRFKDAMVESIKIKLDTSKSKKDTISSIFTFKDKGVNSSKYSFVGGNERFISFKVHEKLKSIEHFDNCLIQDTIKSVEYFGKVETFDLELEICNFFFCNGLYVHNSGRRGALLETVSIYHPDSEKFIDAKLDLTKITGANISVKVDNRFMYAVQNDEEITLRFPLDKTQPTEVSIPVRAQYLWGKIITSNRLSAEPGVLFWDTVVDHGPSNPYIKDIACNPCIPGFATALTPEGILTISQVTIGTKIWSSQGWTTVTGILPHGIQAVYKYYTKYGSFIGTDNHKILEHGVKVQVKDAEELTILSGENFIERIPNPQAIIDGFIIGNGLWHHNEEDVELLYDSFVPFKYFQSDTNTKLNFLRGLFSVIGVISLTYFVVKVKNFSFAEQIQLMLNTVGIQSFIEYFSDTLYFLHITHDIPAYLRSIGFVQQRKTSKLIKLLMSQERVSAIQVPLIEDVESLGDFEVFDITVDNSSHTYWANGVDVSNCVRVGTLVNTPYGYKKVETLREGDIVNTVLGDEPIATIEKYVAQTYKIVFEDGGVQYVTGAHQYHIVEENSQKVLWKKVYDLEIGDRVRTHATVFEDTTFDKGLYERGVKQGILLGDGCYTTKRERVYISSNTDDSEYNTNLKELFGVENFAKDRLPNDNSKSITFPFHTSYNVVSLLNLTQSYSFEKYIPEECFSSYSQLLGVLDGLLATDGNVNSNNGSPQVRFFTTSQQLARDIRKALLCFNCYPTMVEKSDKGGVIHGREVQRQHTVYVVHISGISLKNFACESRVQNVHPQKGEKLHTCMEGHVYRDNRKWTKVVSVTPDMITDVYDIYCEKSDTWVTEGYVQRGCGEITLPPFDSCRLITVNLVPFVKNPFTTDATFNYEDFGTCVYTAQRLMDDLVDLDLECIQSIIDKIHRDPEPMEVKAIELATMQNFYNTAQRYRRTGLGILGLADVFAAMGYAYASTEALALTESIMQCKMSNEFASSIDMAIERGSFVDYDPVLDAHSTFMLFFRAQCSELYERMQLHGRRNVSLSTISPTGSIAIIAQVSSGMEPVYQLEYVRRRKITDKDNYTIDFIDLMGDKWSEYPVTHPGVTQWLQVHPGQSVQESPYYGNTAHDIDPMKKLNLHALLQRYTTHSISNTYNLPELTTNAEISALYFAAWQKGIKGITVYVEGSRSGVLVSNETHKKQNLTYIRRPQILPCTMHEFQCVHQGIFETWVAFVGLHKNVPFEIFLGPKSALYLPQNISSCEIRKVKVGTVNKYFLYVNVNNDTGTKRQVCDLAVCFNKEYWNYAKLVSGLLRHGMPIEYVVHSLETMQFETVLFHSWRNSVARILKMYIGKGTTSKHVCTECGVKMVFVEGCLQCVNCGMSKCG